MQIDSTPQRRPAEVQAACASMNLTSVDTTVAGVAGADVSMIMISASGDPELQAHVGLTVTRTLRLLALAADDDLWRVWRDGNREVMDLLEHNRGEDAVGRYRRIFDAARERIAGMPFTM